MHSRDNGHIELAADWVNSDYYTGTSGEFDADPKVSGMIKLEGIAKDDTLLRDIKVQFGKSMGGLGTADTIIAHYNEVTGKWGTGSGQSFVEFAATEPTEIPSNTGWKSYIKRATYGELVKVGDLAAAKVTDDESLLGTVVNGVKKEYLSTALVPETSQEFGHVVHWILYLDTSKVEGVAVTDVSVTATALDRGTPKWNATDNKVNYSTNGAETTVTDNNTGFSGAVTKAGNNISVADMTGNYRIDVVPYITEIETSLYKSLKTSIRTAYSRTALGHYIARLDENEKIIIKGFNLTGGTVKFTPDNEGSTANKTYNENGISVPSNAKSGELTMVVNNVEILNNKNNNNASGSYSQGITESSSYTDKNTYAYNRMPNRTSNNLLTDDVYIDIWQFDSDAAKPRSGELREPVMSINPKTGKVGVAFVSGPGDFAMAGGLNSVYDANANSNPADDIYSYSLWQNNFATFNNVAFAYDSNGFAHATTTGLDTNPSDGSKHAGRFSYFYNRWGRSGTTTTGNYDGLNAVRLESIAVPNWTKTTRDFEPTYLRNLNGEVPTETIKKLLIKGVVPETTSLTETRFYSPSLAATVHGSGDSATTAVYLAYYDSVQGQIRFRYTDEMPQTWDSNLTYENLIVDKTANTWSIDPDSTYNEEYITGSTPTIDKGKLVDGGFKNLHHGNNDVDDFVDNLGYFIKPNDYEAYMEANTDHFSLIAGVDYQGGENDITTTSYNVNVNKTDNDGNVLYTTVYRRALTQDDSIVLDQNKKDAYEIKTKKLSNNEIKLLHADLKSRFNTTNTISYIVKSSYWWIIQPDGLIYMGTKDANNPDAQGRYTHKLKTAAETTDLEGYYLNGEYDVYEKIKSKEEDDPDYYIVDTSAPEFFIPYHNKTISVSVPITKQEVIKIGYDTGYTAYKYVAIDAKTGTDAANDVVVAVWYDGTNCRYAYNSNPTSGMDNGSAGGWDGNKVIFTEGGEYCTVKFDSDGGVHIAAYVDGSLRYAYLPSYDAEYTEATDSVRVDSFTITGERINLDVGKEKVGNTENYVVVPYISYFNGTARKPTVAKLVIPENGVMNYKAQGTDDDDVFTGNWEITLVPSGSTLTTNYYDKMNIALWKWEGKIVKSNDSNFGTVVTAKTSTDNTSNGTNGDIYGNGTANPILGYAVESTSGTYLETAQMR